MSWRLVERRARQLLSDWRALLAKHVEAKHVEDVRPLLRELLKGPITFTPIIEERRRGYHFAGGIKTGGFLLGIVEGNQSGVPGRI